MLARRRQTAPEAIPESWFQGVRGCVYREVNAGVFVASGQKGHAFMKQLQGYFDDVGNRWSVTHKDSKPQWSAKGAAAAHSAQ